jgi:hypothetical protein
MQKRLGTVQNFTLSNTSQASAKFGAQTYRVRVAVGSTGTAPTNAYILFGDSTALTVSSTNGSLVPSLWAEDFDVTPGQTFYTVSQTTLASGAGVLTVTELS